jgi:putative transposase
MNFTTVNPLTGKAQRMMLIMVVDMKTLIPFGWEIMATENTYAITSALRRAIKNLGFLPRAVYIDNGRANKSKHFMGDKKKWYEGDTTEAVGIFTALGIKVFVAKPYHGQSKVVERVFGILSEFERRMISYTGINIENKPARLMRNEKFYIEQYKKFWNEKRSAGKETPAPEIHEAMFMLRIWINEYAHRKHRSGKQKGLSPYEVLDRSLAKIVNTPDYEQRLISDDRLRLLMMPQTITKLYRNGIRIPRRGYYYNRDLARYDKRKDRVRFLVRYDLLDADSIYIYDAETGEFICEAYPRGEVNPIVKINGTEEDEQLLNSQLQEPQAIAKVTKDELRKIYGMNDIPTAEQTKKLIALHASDKAKKKDKKEPVSPRRGETCWDVEEPVKTEIIKPDYSINEAV